MTQTAEVVVFTFCRTKNNDWLEADEILPTSTDQRFVPECQIGSVWADLVRGEAAAAVRFIISCCNPILVEEVVTGPRPPPPASLWSGYEWVL